MRVLHLTRDFPPRHHGGISTAVGGLAHAAARAGLTVSVISFDDWRPRRAAPAAQRVTESDESGVTVLRISAPAQLEHARAVATSWRPDLLHVHHGMLWPLAATLRTALAVPAVKTVHVVQQRMNALRGSDELTASIAGQEAALAGADRIVAPSHAAAAALLEVYPAISARLRVAPHGTDDPVDDPPPPTDSAPRFLSIGRFDEVKGTPELFALIPRLLHAHPGAAYVIAGGVPANPRAERRWMARWEDSTEPPIRRRVAFTGWLDESALRQQLRSATAVLITSRFETFGLVALEAMRQGVAVVATAAGGLAEVISDGETGLLAPVGDIAALIDHAAWLARDPVLRRRLGTAAIARVRERFTWERVLPSMLAIYRELV